MTERSVLKIIIMAPRTEQQFEIIREERKDQIKQVALELIAQEGFSNVTISKIASKAKISKGLIYNYFESKEELIIEIMMNGIKEFAQAFDPNKDGVLTDDELHFLIDETCKILESNMKFWRLYFMIMFQPEVHKLIQDDFMKMMEPFLGITYNYFQKKGYKDPESEVFFFGALLDGVALNFVMNPKGFPLDGIRKKLHSLYK
jgi:AcrR family transcriptional regulator